MTEIRDEIAAQTARPGELERLASLRRRPWISWMEDGFNLECSRCGEHTEHANDLSDFELLHSLCRSRGERALEEALEETDGLDDPRSHSAPEGR